MNALRRRWPLPAAILLLLITIAGIIVVALVRDRGVFTYGLDDPYIHMAIARNLVVHGLWGVTPDAFVSASSSPLWILILSIFQLLGISLTVVPLLLNVLSATAILVLGYRESQREGH